MVAAVERVWEQHNSSRDVHHNTNQEPYHDSLVG